jgi:hypothetical protein
MAPLTWCNRRPGLQEAVDPQAMLEALERASETEPPKDQETTKPPTRGGHI